MVFKCKASYFVTCVVAVVDYDNLTIVTEIIGKDVNVFQKVEKLEVYKEKKLTQIPRGIEKFFNNIRHIVWVPGALKIITANDLKPFTKLALLDLTDNQITSLDGDLFKYSGSINFIHFAYNPISQIGYDFLAGLTELQRVDLFGCKCISYTAYNKKLVEKLKKYLRSQCAPLATTTQATIIFMPTKIIRGRSMR